MAATRISHVILAVILLLPACRTEEAAEAPRPHELTRAATGYYCNMIVEDHPGPKGQIFLSDRSEPIWFSSARDTVAFTLLPEEPKNVSAIYVNDMGRASWSAPEPDTWIDAKAAWYVVGSNRRGGMGAPEVVPFARRDAAEAFLAEHGGRVAAFEEIPVDAVLGMVSESAGPAGMDAGHGTHTAQGEDHQ